MSSLRVIALSACLVALAGTPTAFAFTIDNQTGNNPDGSARYRDPDQTLPHFSAGFSGWPGAYVRGDSYSSGDMLVPPYHPPAPVAPIPQNPMADQKSDPTNPNNR